jgi:hypothetical protein
MEDCRAALLRAHADALLSRPRTRTLTAEAARLNAKADSTLAARAAGVSQWGSELSPLFLQLVLELLNQPTWGAAVLFVMRAVCSTWCSIIDAMLPRLRPRGSAAVMKGKLGWYQSLTELNLTRCMEEDVSGVLAELGSMPSLRNLALRSSCAERAVDAEVVCGLTMLTTLCFLGEIDENYMPVAGGVLVLDLSRLTTLTSLSLQDCAGVTDKEVLVLSSLTGLTSLGLCDCPNVTSEGVRAVSNLTALSSLDLNWCPNVSAAARQALRTAIPNLYIYDQHQ